MKISFAELALPKTGAVVLGVGTGNKLGASARQLDKATDGAITRALKVSKFEGKAKQLLEIVAPAGVPNSRILLAGIGDKMSAGDQCDLGGRVSARLNQSGEEKATFIVDFGGRDQAGVAAEVGLGALLRSYSFTKYRTKKEENGKATLSAMTLSVKGSAAMALKPGFRLRTEGRCCS